MPNKTYLSIFSIKRRNKMGYISSDVFRRLFVLCLIAVFEHGVYGALRLQKVAYAIEREASKKLFQFKHAPFGQYSEDLEYIKEQLISMGYISAVPLGGSNKGNRYVLTEKDNRDHLCSLMESFAPDLEKRILQVVEEIGYKPEKELRHYAYTFEEFINSDLNDILFESNIPDMIEADGLSEDECDEIELALTPTFITSMSKIIQGLEETNIDLDKVSKFAPKF
jgi:uncharacterized protein YwgA